FVSLAGVADALQSARERPARCRGRGPRPGSLDRRADPRRTRESARARGRFLNNEVMDMMHQHPRAIAILVAFLTVAAGVALAQQDRFTLKAGNGVAFSEFRGYDAWQAIAPSQTDDGVKVI